MPIRIDRIKINRGGPLKADFNFEPGDINLIYGHNETGKSYIVEAIINFLFRTGKKSTDYWQPRGLNFAGGAITVSSLPDGPVKFSRTNKKLDDYWEKEIGLPPDFSRLLVVKEGETRLTAEPDGVGESILRNCLSGVSLLDRIEKRIPDTVKKAEVCDKEIHGDQMGEIKQRKEYKNSRVKLDDVLRDTENAYTSARIPELQRKQREINTELEMLEKAKRYHAYCLKNQIDDLKIRKEALPSEEALSKLESDINVYEDRIGVVHRKTAAIAELETAEQNYKWADNALEYYKEITTERMVTAPKPIYMVLAFFLLIGTVVAGFLNFRIPMAILAAGSLAFSIFYLMGMRRVLASAGVNKELERLKAELRSRYGFDDIVTLKAQFYKLGEEHIEAKTLKKELEEELTPDLKSRDVSIGGEFRRFTGKEIPSKDWRSTITELRSELGGLTDNINSLDKKLISLSVSEEDLLDQDPGIEWDPNSYNTLKERQMKIGGELNEEQQNLEKLKIRIASETNSDSTDWEDLIGALRVKREKVARDYRDWTAKILAKIHVNTVIQELRKEENTKIAFGLASDTLTNTLYAITGCYKGMRYDDEDGLMLITDEDEEYRLAEVSTGAREQALLAMRMGFSSMMMKGQTAFLILDDAFQHSDWPRRTNLTDQILRVVQSGWQVFYFTMDNHIRDLFLKVGEKVGDRFKSLELC